MASSEFCKLLRVLCDKESLNLRTSKLGKLGDYDVVAANIEGGVPGYRFRVAGGWKSKAMYKRYPEGIWANLCVVLDRPLITGKTLDAVTSGSKAAEYALKESAIEEFNEQRVNLAYLLILKYYISFAPLKITCQIHRGSSAKHQIAVIKKLLSESYGSRYYEVSENTVRVTNGLGVATIVFRNGYKIDDCDHYGDSDCVISLSMVCGLEYGLPSGSLLLPDKFIPMDFKVDASGKPYDHVLYETMKYSVTNDLVHKMRDVLCEQSKKVVGLVNSIPSKNPEKAHMTTEKLTYDDFHFGSTLAQIPSIWNPTDAETEMIVMYD